MTEHTSGYAVFLFEQAWEALGEAIKPYGSIVRHLLWMHE